MANYYQPNDFQEYEHLLDSKDEIACIVHNLNKIISTQQEVCDMYICMSHFMKYKSIHQKLKRFVKSDLAKDVYMYFKFLLLDDQVKDRYYETIIIPISNLLHYILKDHFACNKLFYNGDTDSDFDFLSVIYDMNNDDTLLNFMDHTNARNEYQRLDEEKIRNIEYRPDFYLTDNFYEKFTFITWMFESIKFTYNFVYYMSNTPEYQSMLREGEISISSKEDFMRRYKSNTEKFIRLYNFIQNCGINISIQEYDTIPTNRIIIPTNKIIQDGTPDVLLTSENVSLYVQKLIFLIFETPMHSNYIFYTPFNKFLLKHNYNYQSDNYKMIIKEDTTLKKRFKSYFKSELYVSLDYINYIYSKYKNNSKMSEFTNYIYEILQTHHFNKMLKY